MDSSTIEFGIVIVSHQADDRAVIAGRCYQGPIRLGDTFEEIYTLTPVKTADGYGPSIRGGSTSIRLTVTSIRAYRHSFESLDTGLTAELVLVGQGVNLLSPRTVLGTHH